MSKVVVVALLLAGAAALQGCASRGTPQTSASAQPSNGVLHRIGLTAGPLPQPKPFVVQSRPTTVAPTPFIYAEPPARSDVVLNADQQQQLEASLAAKAVTPPPVARRKKAPVNQRINPLF